MSKSEEPKISVSFTRGELSSLYTILSDALDTPHIVKMAKEETVRQIADATGKIGAALRRPSRPKARAADAKPSGAKPGLGSEG